MSELRSLQTISLSFVLLSSLTIFPVFMDPINLPKFFMLLLGGSVIFLFMILNKFYLLRKVNKHIILIVTLYIVLLITAGLFSKQSIFATLSGTWGRNNGLIMSMLFMLFFLVFAIPSKIDLSENILRVLFLFGLFSSSYAWLQFFNKDPIQYYFPWYNKNDALIITVGNSNFASIFLAMTFAVTLATFFRQRKFSYFRGLAILSIVSHLLLLPKLDTQGKISFGVGTVVVVGILGISSKDKNLKLLGVAWWLISAVLGILGLLGLKGIGFFAGILSDNIRSLSDRYFAWLAAVDMMKNSPIFGKGIDAFGFYYRNFRNPKSNELKIGEPFVTYDNAHNTYLQLGATAGVPVLLVYLALISVICWRAWVALRINENKSTIAGLISVWMIYLLQSFISMDQIGLAIWGWVCAGALVGLSFNSSQKASELLAPVSSKSKSFREKIVSFTLGVIILLLPAIYYLPVLQNEKNLYFSIRNIPILKGDTEQQINFNRIIEEGYKSKQLELRLTVVRYLGASNQINEALSLAEFSAEQEPRSFASWHLVAGLYEITGRFKEAIPSRQETIKLDPYNTIIKDLLRIDQAEGIGSINLK